MNFDLFPTHISLIKQMLCFSLLFPITETPLSYKSTIRHHLPDSTPIEIHSSNSDGSLQNTEFLRFFCKQSPRKHVVVTTEARTANI